MFLQAVKCLHTTLRALKSQRINISALCEQHRQGISSSDAKRVQMILKDTTGTVNQGARSNIAGAGGTLNQEASFCRIGLEASRFTFRECG